MTNNSGERSLHHFVRAVDGVFQPEFIAPLFPAVLAGCACIRVVKILIPIHIQQTVLQIGARKILEFYAKSSNSIAKITRT